jgi:hypothetical protein
MYLSVDKTLIVLYISVNGQAARRQRNFINEENSMPQISVSVTQEDYDRAKTVAARYGDVNLANAVRKLVTCYGRRIIFFDGLVPDIAEHKRDEYRAELFFDELPKAEGAPIIEKGAGAPGVTELTDGMTFGQLQSYYPDGTKPMSEEFMEALSQTDGTPDWTWSAAQHKWLAPKKKGSV